MRQAITALIIMLLFVPSAFGLSDNEYRQMMNDSEFRAADRALNQAYRNAKNSLSASDFNALKRDQAQWIKSGRDNEAKRLLRTMSRVEAYTAVTLARAEYINGLTNSPRKATENISDFDMADKLVGEGKIPMYVRDKGKFTRSTEFSIVGINGINVNLRSQPNVNSNVIVQLSRDDTDKWPAYLGEWTHPNGEYWVVGEIKQNGKNKTVWIFGQYAEPMSKEKYSEAKDSINDDSDLPDESQNNDLPDDDVPEDLPDLPDEPKQQKSQPKKAAVSSQEQAQEIITDKLLELDEITPTETLDANGTTEIDGETCWEFTSPVSYRQYAISPEGKIYVHDGDKYSPVK